ncbi:MFS general substrate transporter [Cucurbitaria berberidis CBS 394.84]|uniref:MFS general substrate transporter n=1 Tax=Cucurbitaria berberidis CBS 394.84 TaxID=1168544 RepID=A0A9P4L6Q2_9PLEO|nr:MFS general substrate transporter [Cucurbitaria berberidis CBS 394.84]KAF1843529.1 MFS general substrate transporter [Cucurbitaria berberidis CBS 394.84]
MGFFKKPTLRNRDDKRTRAAELTLRESIYPLCLVTILFFLWGFSYGLIDTLNKHFQEVLGITRSRSSGLQAAYFGAYPLASLGHANWLLRHWGYKAVFIWGLFLYGLGSLIAWPCLVYRSFGGFCVAIFIIGNGLGSLETAANPYLAVCGPPKYSEIRINIAQAFNGIGTVVAPVLGSYVFFKNTGTDVNALKNVQWTYLAIACFVFALAVVFYFSPIPEITDADMAFQAESTHAGTDVQPFRKQYRLFHATFAQFCYTGAQVAIAGAFINYVTETRVTASGPTSSSTAARFLAGAQGAFTLGRFAGSAIMKFVRPRWVFFVFMTLCIIFIIPSITERGNTGMSMLYIVLFFESIIFPTIVALGMRGLGKYSKRGSGLIVAGVSGGAIVPPLLFAASDSQGAVNHETGHAPTAIAMTVPLAFFIAAWTYTYCVNFVPAYRDVADKFSTTELGIVNAHANDAENQIGSSEGSGGVLAKDEAPARKETVQAAEKM